MQIHKFGLVDPSTLDKSDIASKIDEIIDCLFELEHRYCLTTRGEEINKDETSLRVRFRMVDRACSGLSPHDCFGMLIGQIGHIFTSFKKEK